MNTLTPSQIEVLARFLGWKHFPETKTTNEVYQKDDDMLYPDELVWQHLTSPGVLISMRLNVLKKLQKMEGMYGEEVKFNEEVTDLILSGEYTAAAIKTSEIIQKLEA
jgi:hypothetical protein